MLQSRTPLCSGEGLDLTPGQQAAASAVDHLEANRPQAVDNAEHRNVMEDRALVVGALEVVVGDLGAEMVDVMKADVAGEELEELRKLQVGASLQGGVGVAPLDPSSPSRRPRTDAGRRT